MEHSQKKHQQNIEIKDKNNLKESHYENINFNCRSLCQLSSCSPR